MDHGSLQFTEVKIFPLQDIMILHLTIYTRKIGCIGIKLFFIEAFIYSHTESLLQSILRCKILDVREGNKEKFSRKGRHEYYFAKFLHSMMEYMTFIVKANNLVFVF